MFYSTIAAEHAVEAKVVPAQGGSAPWLSLVGAVEQEIVQMNYRGVVPVLLNLGAGSNTAIETRLDRAGARFFIDRVDLELTVVHQANVRNQWAGNIEDLSAIANDSYDLAFANYVLEHVEHVRSAVAEMARVVRPGALIVLTLPNPGAPEFRVSARSPRWFQRVFKPRGFETRYAYRSVPELVNYLHTAGMRLEMVQYSPVVGPYLSLISRLAGRLGSLYDSAVVRLRARCLCGAVFVVARKA